MNPKHFFFLLVPVSFLVFAGCARMPVQQSSWQQPCFLVDGESSDWAQKLLYEPESGYLYGFSNDTTHLYVALKISDQVEQRKLFSTGLTCWIDPAGKGKQQLSILFPVTEMLPGHLQQEINSEQGFREKRGLDHPGTDQLNKRFQGGLARMILKGFSEGGEEQVMMNLNPGGINAMVHIDSNGLLIYEASIPLAMLFPEPEKYLADSTSYFSLGFETGSLEGMTGDQGDLSGGMSHGGQGSMGGGRSGGGMPGGGMPGGGGSTMGGRGGPPGGGQGKPGSGDGPQMNPEKMEMMQRMSKPSKCNVKRVCLSNPSY